MPSMNRNDIDRANRYHAYLQGWRCGAKGGTPDAKITGHHAELLAAAYIAGLRAGRLAFNHAARYATREYGHTPSILREETKS